MSSEHEAEPELCDCQEATEAPAPAACSDAACTCDGGRAGCQHAHGGSPGRGELRCCGSERVCRVCLQGYARARPASRHPRMGRGWGG